MPSYAAAIARPPRTLGRGSDPEHTVDSMIM
jgi:hypothetical protein